MFRGTKKLRNHPFGQSAGETPVKILFWNVQGLSTKTTQLHDYLSQFKVILLVETFIEEKFQIKMEAKLPKGFNWFWTAAVRDKARGRPWGGELIGVARDLKWANEWRDEKNCCNGMDVVIGGATYNFINVYCRNGVKTIRRVIEPILEENINKRIIAVGDWNARLGTLGSRSTINERKDSRQSQDTVTNTEGELLHELCEDYGLHVMNGNIEGDWEGKITHIGYRSQAVLDYALANEDAWNNIREFTVGDQILSDHFPLEITLQTRAATAEKTQQRVINVFNPDTIPQYQLRLGKENEGARDWSSLAAGMRRACIKKTIRDTTRRADRWWNNECYEARRETKRELRSARISGDFSGYREARRRYKRIVKERKRLGRDEFMAKLKNIRNIADGWKFINSNRKLRPTTMVRPKDNDMAHHFVELLNGTLSGQEAALSSQSRGNGVAEYITEEEFVAHIKHLKHKKAAGIDGLQAEAIIYADSATKETLRKLMSEFLNGRGLPSEWREALIYPLYKKGDPAVAKNYRGISIINSGYKLYANILNSRLERFVEDNQILPDTQNGFRKKRSTIDSIFILNHCVQSALKNGNHLYTCFVDFKAAFDTVNRCKLFRRMRNLNFPEYLVTAIEDIYKKTTYTIGNTNFCTDMGLRQGCPISPLLFAIYISDIDKVLNNWQSGGVRIGDKKLHCLAYADDIVLMATTPGELKDMIATTAKFAGKRDLKISTDKTKVLRFSKNGIKSTQRWQCNGTAIEEVKSFCYLGFMFQSNGNHTEHIKMLARNGQARVSSVWSLGERLFPDNFRIRRQMYNSLVEPCLMYGCELFGMQEQSELEKVQRKYMRWVLGVAPWTRTALLMAETNSTPVYTRTIKRAFSYEHKALHSSSETLRECMKERTLGKGTREKALNQLGLSSLWIEEMQEIINIPMAIQHRATEQFQQLQFVELKRQSVVSPGHLADYLGRGRSYKVVARFRLQNEEKACQDWRKDKDCRVCRAEPETIGHILRCSGSTYTTERLLNVTGSGVGEMERIKQWQSANEAETTITCII